MTHQQVKMHQNGVPKEVSGDAQQKGEGNQTKCKSTKVKMKLKFW